MKNQTGVNWRDARRRLRAAESYVLGESRTERDVARILEERAQRLSIGPVEEEVAAPGNLLMIFSAGPGRFGIPLINVAEVITRRPVARVPGAPAVLAGLAQVRGEIYPVYDLPLLLDVSTARLPEPKFILILKAGQILIGIGASELDDLRRVGPEDQQPPPAGTDYALWMTQDLVMVLDTANLLRKVA